MALDYPKMPFFLITRKFVPTEGGKKSLEITFFHSESQKPIFGQKVCTVARDFLHLNFGNLRARGVLAPKIVDLDPLDPPILDRNA